MEELLLGNTSKICFLKKLLVVVALPNALLLLVETWSSLLLIVLSATAAASKRMQRASAQLLVQTRGCLCLADMADVGTAVSTDMPCWSDREVVPAESTAGSSIEVGREWSWLDGRVRGAGSAGNANGSGAYGVDGCCCC
eukprot:scaffold2254_cov393-Prasinococcus_capsulatus_cf.AAC.3